MLLFAALAFNLECSGQETFRTASRDEGRAYSITYRIDLESDRYCENECTLIREIAKTEPAKIWLKLDKVDTPRNAHDRLIVIDRTTGEHTELDYTTAPYFYSAERTGSCEVAPFTNFPNPKTKF